MGRVIADEERKMEEIEAHKAAPRASGTRPLMAAMAARFQRANGLLLALLCVLRTLQGGRGAAAKAACRFRGRLPKGSPPKEKAPSRR